MSKAISISVAGENSLIVYFGDSPSAAIATQIAQTVAYLKTVLGDLLVDLVPSYASLLVIYQPLQTDHYYITSVIRSAIREPIVKIGNEPDQDQKKQQGNSVSLPVYYSTESGPDLQSLADRAKLSVEEVIAIHQQTEYRVYAIGFAPGFAYLGEVDERIASPR